jgi:ribonuclease HI
MVTSGVQATAADAALRGERDLLRAEVRGDRQALERLLHPGFEEVGRSGRIWSRDAMIEALVADPAVGDTLLADAAATELAPGVVMVRYHTTGARPTHRVSVWVHDGGDWRIRYHQGTAINAQG